VRKSVAEGYPREPVSLELAYHRANGESPALVRNRGERLVPRRRSQRRAPRDGLLPRPGRRAARDRRRARRVPAAHLPRSAARSRRQHHRPRRLADRRLRDGSRGDPARRARARRRIAPRHA